MANKRQKLPACDPCRFSKLACDHAKPVCSRCRTRNRPNECTYRLKPFKKAKGRESTDSATQSISPFRDIGDASSAEHPVTTILTKPHRYPNPGYLGSSSHTTLFRHLSATDDMESGTMTGHTGKHGHLPSECSVSEVSVAHGARFLEELDHRLPISNCVKLVQMWLARGLNLALAEPFTACCITTAELVLSGRNQEAAMDISRKLFHNTCSQLIMDTKTTLDQYSNQFNEQKPRWESLGLFFAAISRATMDLVNAEGLYDSPQQRRELWRLAMHYSDLCLDISVSLDCMNDLQLLLQYENFILHSHVDGDQSYHSWKKLGDVGSSIFALGYHEQMEINPAIPPFLVEFRQDIFAHAYSADINVSIFLGRPPRVHRKYCRFRLPGYNSGKVVDRTPNSTQLWDMEGALGFAANARWAAICAVLKEDVLDLFDEKHSDIRLKKASDIEADTEAHWEALPPRMRLNGPILSCSESPIERDVIVNVRLNHLHVHFLLQLALARHTSEPNARLVSVAAEMLALAVEAVMNKDQLTNSGTSLGWKVVYYGLAAAGIICRALMNQQFPDENRGAFTTRVCQHLSVLVVAVDTGTLVHIEDPNYALLVKATKTIDALLGRLMTHGSMANSVLKPASDSPQPCPPAESQDDWLPWGTDGVQDFENDFWNSLADHPFLADMESGAQDFSQHFSGP